MTAAAVLAAAPRRSVLPSFSSVTGRVQWIGVGILGAMTAAAIVGPWLSPYEAGEFACTPFEAPSAGHWLGCNDVGQDIATRLLLGGRISLAVGFSVALLSTVVATFVALTSGYRGGLIDQAFMRFVDVVMSLPLLPLVIVLGTYFGASIAGQVLVISFVMWAPPSRELRSQVLSIRSAEYVEAAASMGAGPWRISFHHIVPELAPLIVPQFVRVAHRAILIESSLSFLGLGDPVQNSWGTMLFHANARTAFLTGAWKYWVLPPGLAIALAVVAFAFIGFGFGAEEAGKRKAAISRRRAASPSPLPDPAAKLSVRDLTVLYTDFGNVVRAVEGIALDVGKGEILGLVGESGSGKTTAALAVLGLLKSPAVIASGRILLDGADLLGMSEKELRGLRGKRIALVPQSAMNALNPVMTVGAQLIEAITLHGSATKREARARAAELLDMVELPRERLGAYPHELSGGMRQRVVIAIALANQPELIVADEPTTGLDVLVQAEIVRLLADLQRRLGVSVLFVTHNLPLIARIADRLAVMFEGRIVDVGAPAALEAHATHPHTAALFANVPHLDEPKKWVRPAPDDAVPLLELRHVSKSFRGRLTARLSRGKAVAAVNDLSLTIRSGEVVGLVGGSGSGKTTTARLIVGRYRPDAGEILFRGSRIDTLTGPERKRMRHAVHMVFQDPYQSLRSGMRIRDIVAEPLRIQGERDAHAIEERVKAALSSVQLPSTPAFLARRPTALSGGQRQRVAFARAIVTNPAIIIADEPTSMLDQSIRMGILGLMERLRTEYGTSFICITHDMVLARHFCDRLAVMHDGCMVEEAAADDVALRPQHPYTKALIEAVEAESHPRTRVTPSLSLP